MLDTDYPYFPTPNYPAQTSSWILYFERNAAREADLPFDAPPAAPLPPRLHAALARTLARFHLGESGEGTYLKRFAAQTGDAAYQRAIEMFVREEQDHSRWFGLLLQRLDAPALTHHWSDAIFTKVRRAGGLHFELITFLTAEIIAQRFFGSLAKHCPEPVAAAIFAQVVRDESAHIAFHIETLRRAFEGQSRWRRRLWDGVWRALLAAAIALVCLDQSAIFRELKLSRWQFAARCFEIFEIVSGRIWTEKAPLSLSPLHLFSPHDAN